MFDTGKDGYILSSSAEPSYNRIRQNLHGSSYTALLYSLALIWSETELAQ